MFTGWRIIANYSEIHEDLAPETKLEDPAYFEISTILTSVWNGFLPQSVYILACSWVIIFKNFKLDE